MPTVTLNPNADGQGGTDFAALADVSDATFVQPGGWPSFSRTQFFETFSIPAGAAVRSVNVRARLDRNSGTAGPEARAYYNLFGVGYQTLPSVLPPFGSIQEFDMGTVTAAHSQTQIDNIDVQISDEVVGGSRWYKLWVNVLYASAPGAPTGVSMSPTTTRRPGVTWTHTPGADSVGGQTGFQFKVFSAAQYGAGGFNPDTSGATYDSGQINLPTSTGLVGSNLANGTTYKVYVRTWQTTNGVQQVSPWGISGTFTVSITVPTPTAVTPANGTTVTTSKPAIGASVAAMGDGVLVKRQWQVASDSGFTTSLQTVDTDTLQGTKSGTIAWPVALTRLAQGVWWIRARTVDEYGQTSAYTSPQSFTVAHQPSTTNRQPSGAQSLPYDPINNDVDVTWTFSDIDTEDFQTKYEAELWKLSDPVGSLKTTGTVVSGLGTANFNTLDATWKDNELRWRVRVADQDNVFSAWSVDQAFYLRDAPVVTITSPADAGVVSTPTPQITWTFSATGGRTQSSYRVIVTDTDTSTVVADSGVILGAALLWVVPTPVVLVGTNYSVQVITVDSTGLSGSDTNNFTATYAAPTTPIFIIDGSDFEDQGRVLIDWSSSAADSTILAWRIYRRIWGFSTWTLVAEVPATDRIYYDYLCPSQTRVEYAVVQVAESFGAPVESGYPIEEFEGVSTGYFLVVPDDDAYNLKLEHVTGDSFEDEQEMATLNLIGRGRRVEYGTRYGQTGTLEGAFYNNEIMTARQQRLFLEAIRDSGLKVYLRNPFGDVWAVAMPSAQITRIAGTGLVEQCTFSLSYTEITA